MEGSTIKHRKIVKNHRSEKKPDQQNKYISTSVTVILLGVLCHAPGRMSTDPAVRAKEEGCGPEPAQRTEARTRWLSTKSWPKRGISKLWNLKLTDDSILYLDAGNCTSVGRSRQTADVKVREVAFLAFGSVSSGWRLCCYPKIYPAMNLSWNLKLPSLSYFIAC